MTHPLRHSPKTEKPKERDCSQVFLAFAVVLCIAGAVSKMYRDGWFITKPNPTSAKTRYELSLERDNAELRETNQAYQRALRTALDDAKAITDRFSRTVFPVEDQKFLVDLLTKENEQLRTDKAVEIEKRLIMAREAAWIEKNGGEIVAVKVEERK